jgi:GAF domain-containing protein
MVNMTRADSFTRLLADVARSLQAEASWKDTMELAVALAVEVVDDAQDAAISLISRSRTVDTPAATSERAFKVDQIQYELKQGPFLSAIWDEEVVSCPNLEAEDRWGQWAPRTVRETEIRSMLSFRMFTQKDRVGALSLYSTHPHAFTGADVDSGISLAAHTAIAVVTARHEEHMEIALDARSLIGQATGIVMDRYNIDAVRAFAVLKRISQQTNVKLHDVAAELIRTRSLPS